jgi:LPS-assembly lipoprotein
MSIPDINTSMAQASFSPAARAHLLPDSAQRVIRDPLVKAQSIAIRIGCLMSLCLLLSACGFQLRESAQLPPEMNHTQLLIGDEYSQLARRVRIHLEQAGVKIVNQGSATAILEIPKNEVLTEVLSIGDNARVREYRITHTVQFRLTDPQGKDIVPLQTIRQSRDISFDEQQILAVSREQEYVKEDLANTLSRLLISRLEIVGSKS